MGILRHLQHWLSGQGPQLQTAAFVPETHPSACGPIPFRGMPWSMR
jgi:hypothetical protein